MFKIYTMRKINTDSNFDSLIINKTPDKEENQLRYLDRFFSMRHGFGTCEFATECKAFLSFFFAFSFPFRNALKSLRRSSIPSPRDLTFVSSPKISSPMWTREPSSTSSGLPTMGIMSIPREMGEPPWGSTNILRADSWLRSRFKAGGTSPCFSGRLPWWRRPSWTPQWRRADLSTPMLTSNGWWQEAVSNTNSLTCHWASELEILFWRTSEGDLFEAIIFLFKVWVSCLLLNESMCS